MPILLSDIKGLPPDIKNPHFLDSTSLNLKDLDERIAQVIYHAVIDSEVSPDITISDVTYKNMSGYTACAWQDSQGSWNVYLINESVYKVKASFEHFSQRLDGGT